MSYGSGEGNGHGYIDGSGYGSDECVDYNGHYPGGDGDSDGDGSGNGDGYGSSDNDGNGNIECINYVIGTDIVEGLLLMGKTYG